MTECAASRSAPWRLTIASVGALRHEIGESQAGVDRSGEAREGPARRGDRGAPGKKVGYTAFAVPACQPDARDRSMQVSSAGNGGRDALQGGGSALHISPSAARIGRHGPRKGWALISWSMVACTLAGDVKEETGRCATRKGPRIRPAPRHGTAPTDPPRIRF